MPLLSKKQQNRSKFLNVPTIKNRNESKHHSAHLLVLLRQNFGAARRHLRSCSPSVPLDSKISKIPPLICPRSITQIESAPERDKCKEQLRCCVIILLNRGTCLEKQPWTFSRWKHCLMLEGAMSKWASLVTWVVECCQGFVLPVIGISSAWRSVESCWIV